LSKSWILRRADSRSRRPGPGPDRRPIRIGLPPDHRNRGTLVPLRVGKRPSVIANRHLRPSMPSGQILRIEARRERRADLIVEHDRQLAPLGLGGGTRRRRTSVRCSPSPSAAMGSSKRRRCRTAAVPSSRRSSVFNQRKTSPSMLCRGTRAYIVGARFAFSLLRVRKPPSASRGVKPLSSVTEQLVATEPGIQVPQGNTPDRDRTNTKPWVPVHRHRGRNHSRSHSRRCNREPLLARLRVVQGQHRDLSRDQLPTRHRDDHDVANLRHASRRSNYRRHASQRQRYARPHQRRAARRHRSSEAHRRASHPRSQYLHPHAQPPPCPPP